MGQGKRQLGIVALVLVVILLFPTAVFAHRPIFADGAGASFATAVKIPNPEVSWAIYATLEQPSQVAYYSFEATRGHPLFAQILVPKIDGLQIFRPALALVGPTLPRSDTSLPVELPPRMGALVVEYSASEAPEEFFEPFTQTSYWVRQELRVELPADETYYLLVFDREGAVGKYIMAVGEREEFGLRDLLSFPVTWWRVHWWFGHGIYLVAAVTGFTVLLLTAVAVLRKRRRSG